LLGSDGVSVYSMNIVSIDELDFSKWVRQGDAVLWGQAGAEPLVITQALMDQRHAIGSFDVFVGMSLGDTVHARCADVVRFRSYCGAGRNRGLAKANVLDILPCHYSQLGDMIRSEQLKVDVLLLQVAPADTDGRFSLSIAHEYLVPAIHAARIVMAEINSQAPWTYGEQFVREADIDFAVFSDRAPLQLTSPLSSPVESAVACRVAGMIEDRSTLQIGIGSIPDAVLRALSDHRDLGIHTGALTDQAAMLSRQGVVTNAFKSLDQGITIAGVMMGSRAVYDYAHKNSQVLFRSSDYTHSANVLAGIDRFVALNSAVEVDLTGQINSEVASGVYVGAVGGALDFLRGAHRSRGGLPIVALPSTAAASDRTVSRIVNRLSGPVSTARADAGIVVTEHGVADLRGLSVSQRMDKMLSLADPRFSGDLDRQIGR
jgi:acyl-CoA hydrolase